MTHTQVRSATYVLHARILCAALAAVRDELDSEVLALQLAAPAAAPPLSTRVVAAKLAQRVHAFLRAFARQTVPQWGVPWTFAPPGGGLVAFSRASSAGAGAEDTHSDALQWAAGLFFGCVGQESVAALLAAALLEHKIAFLSASAARCSAACIALLELLAPLQWTGSALAVLPPSLRLVLRAPVPVLVGLPWSDCRATAAEQKTRTLSECTRGELVLFVDLDHDAVFFSPALAKLKRDERPRTVAGAAMLRALLRSEAHGALGVQRAVAHVVRRARCLASTSVSGTASEVAGDPEKGNGAGAPAVVGDGNIAGPKAVLFLQRLTETMMWQLLLSSGAPNVDDHGGQ